MNYQDTPLMSIARLELRAGQILVIKLHSLIPDAAREKLVQEIKKVIPSGIKIMILDRDVDLMVLEPEEMANGQE